AGLGWQAWGELSSNACGVHALMTQLFPNPSVGAPKLAQGLRLVLAAGYWVKTTFVLGLLACLLLLAVPSLVQAQENAPFPLPRPTDRVPEGWSPAAAAETEAPADVEVAPLPADQATNAAAAAAAVALDPQPVTLTAQITEDGASIPE